MTRKSQGVIVIEFRQSALTSNGCHRGHPFCLCQLKTVFLKHEDGMAEISFVYFQLMSSASIVYDCSAFESNKDGLSIGKDECYKTTETMIKC